MKDTVKHHGVKGMKWGIRRYQYTDGSLTPAGKRRYNNQQNMYESDNLKRALNKNINDFIRKETYRRNGIEGVDKLIDKNIQLSRIQSSGNFEKFAFYSTYKNEDNQKYLGLFGQNIISRANAEARNAEKIAKRTSNIDDIKKAQELKNKAENIKVYNLKLESIKKLKTPSDENASDITSKLLNESEFRENLKIAISQAKTQMRRPAQQQLLSAAEKSLIKDPSKLTTINKLDIYKALNLSLTFHDPVSNAVQDRFYSEMKKKGYNALLDYNDALYSSYKAKRPIIVFDVDSVRVSAIIEPSHKVVSELNKKYNKERLIRESIATPTSFITSKLDTKMNDVISYVEMLTMDYMNS